MSYSNKDYLLFFRGQATDYKNQAGAARRPRKTIAWDGVAS